MALPKIAVPEFKTTIPSTKQEVYFRPFLVKEEKMLLMALEGNEPDEITNAVINILTSCVKLDEGTIKQLPNFDIEYLFLQIRSKSVNNITKLSLRHKSEDECKHITEYELNLDEVEVVFPEQHENKIMLTDDVGVVMKYPTITTLDLAQQKLSDSNVENILTFFAENIAIIFDGDDVHENNTIEELLEFVEQLNTSQFQKLTNFYATMPYIGHDIKYKCEKCGKEEFIPLRGLNSFFT